MDYWDPAATDGLAQTCVVILFNNAGVSSSSGMVPEWRSGAMVAVLQDWTLAPVNLSAVFPSGRQISRKARECVAFVDSILA